MNLINVGYDSTNYYVLEGHSGARLLVDVGFSSTLPKLQGALDAASCGVKVVHILDGREAHAMLQLLFTQEDCGTAIRSA